MSYKTLALKFNDNTKSNVYQVANATRIHYLICNYENSIHQIDPALLLLIVKLVVWLIQYLLHKYKVNQLGFFGKWLLRRSIRRAFDKFFIETPEYFHGNINLLKESIVVGIVDTDSELVSKAINEVANADV